MSETKSLFWARFENAVSVLSEYNLVLDFAKAPVDNKKKFSNNIPAFKNVSASYMSTWSPATPRIIINYHKLSPCKFHKLNNYYSFNVQ